MTGCGLFGSASSTTQRNTEEPLSRIPFKTREPENFQAEIIETAGETVRRKRIAKKGNWRRVDFDFGEANQQAVLWTDKQYRLDIGRRIAAEAPSAAGGSPQFSELTRELLTTGRPGEFEETSREGPIVRYIVRLADGNASEIVVHYDEMIGMPIKQEFFSIADGGRTLEFTVEMVNFTLEPDTGLFAVPAGFRVVPMNEFFAGPAISAP